MANLKPLVYLLVIYYLTTKPYDPPAAGQHQTGQAQIIGDHYITPAAVVVYIMISSVSSVGTAMDCYIISVTANPVMPVANNMHRLLPGQFDNILCNRGGIGINVNRNHNKFYSGQGCSLR